MAGYEMTDVGITLLEAGYDAERATEAAFSIAAANAFTEACRAAGGRLLEPVMSVEVVTPGEFLGGIIGDINARDGKVSGVGRTRRRIACERRARLGAARQSFRLRHLPSFRHPGPRHLHHALFALRPPARWPGCRFFSF